MSASSIARLHERGHNGFDTVSLATALSASIRVAARIATWGTTECVLSLEPRHLRLDRGDKRIHRAGGAFVHSLTDLPLPRTASGLSFNPYSRSVLGAWRKLWAQTDPVKSTAH